jgi:uncharacterized protein
MLTLLYHSFHKIIVIHAKFGRLGRKSIRYSVDSQFDSAFRLKGTDTFGGRGTIIGTSSIGTVEREKPFFARCEYIRNQCCGKSGKKRKVQRMIRVVVDTNWWITMLINRYDSQLTTILLRNDIVICASQELVSEVLATVRYPKLSKYLNADVVSEFTNTFPQAVEMIAIKTVVSLCRDPKDDFLLALAKDAEADFLITGDKDLLVLGEFGKTKILTLSNFIQKELS